MTKNFDCVEMKRCAQEKIYKETKHMTTKQKAAYHQRSFVRMKTKQAKLRAKLVLVNGVNSQCWQSSGNRKDYF